MVAVVGAIMTWLLATGGLRRLIAFCALGGCGTPENPALGNAMVVASLVCFVGSVGVPVRLSARDDHPVARALLALPAAVAVGLFALALGFDRRSGAEQNVAIVAILFTYAGVLTMRADRTWAIAIGGGVAAGATLGGSVPLGVVVASVVFLFVLGFSSRASSTT